MSDLTRIVASMVNFLEVAFHLILQNRNVYPKFAFKKFRKYGIPVWRCEHNEVAQYITNCNLMVNRLLLTNNLKKVELCILDRSERVTERFAFETSVLTLAEYGDVTTLLADAEQSYRGMLLRIANSTRLLHQNPEGWRFTIQIFSKEYPMLSLDDPEDQNFPWVENPEDPNLQAHIVPITNIDNSAFSVKLAVLQCNS